MFGLLFDLRDLAEEAIETKKKELKKRQRQADKEES